MKTGWTAWVATVRLLQLVLHVLGGYLTVRLRFGGMPQGQREHTVQQWALGMLSRLRVQVQRQGVATPAGPLLMVANHVSWLDILVLHAAGYCRFVSKAEVRHWPLLGVMAEGAGTLFIERASRRDALRVVHRMAESLARGEVLAAFPEGTTSDGQDMLPFHANLIQAAIPHQVPVQPVGVRFVDARTGERSFAPCYIDNETLMQSLWRTLTAPPLVALLTFGLPQPAGERDRRHFAADLGAQVDRLRQAPQTSPMPTSASPFHALASTTAEPLCSPVRSRLPDRS
ncbi:MAG: lysophospholipid acyltransferase family protein [Burkholderiales bacterium]